MLPKYCHWGHQNPDGDASRCLFCSCLCVTKTRKNVSIILEEFSNKYDIIADKNLLLPKENYSDAVFDAFIALDSGDKQRLEKHSKFLIKQGKK